MNTSKRRPHRFVRSVVIGLAALLCTLGAAPREVARGQIAAGAVIIAIPSNDEFYVNRERVERSNVAAEVARRLKLLPASDQVAYIKASSNVEYGTIVAVIDAIHATGYERIGLVADRVEDGRTKSARNAGPPSASGPPAADVTGARTEQRPDAIVVTVHGRAASFVVEVDGIATTQDAMEHAIHEQLSERNMTSVVIVAGAALPYSVIIAVVDAAQSAGAETIGFEIDYLQPNSPKRNP